MSSWMTTTSKEDYTSACFQGGLLGGFSSRTPSKSRHGSTTENMAEQSAGIMFNEILPRSMERAFPKYHTEAAEVEENEDRRVWLRNKVWRSRKVLSDRKEKIQSAMLSWMAEPLDHLWMELQYLDTRTSLIMDLQEPKTNPFKLAFGKLSRVLSERLETGPIGTVYKHFDMDAVEQVWFSKLVQMTIASMPCGLH